MWSEFFIFVMLTINEQVVERGEDKTVLDRNVDMRIKDGIRDHAIDKIIEVFSGIVISNYQQFAV